MANSSRIQGLRPVSQPFGNTQINYYEVATGTAIYKYSPMDLDSNGRAIVAVVKSNNMLLGAAVHLSNDQYAPIDDEFPYMPANPTMAKANSAGIMYVGISDDPNQFYVVEEDTGGGTVLDQQSANAGCDLTYIATTGNTSSGLSNAVLDASTVGTGSNLQLRLIRKWDKPDNAFGNFQKWIVQIQLHRRHPSTTQNGVSKLI